MFRPHSCSIAGAHMTVDGVDTINMATFDFHNLLGRHEIQVWMGAHTAGMPTVSASPLPSPSTVCGGEVCQ